MNRSFYASIILVTFMLGLMLAFQFRAVSPENIAPSYHRGEELAAEKQQLVIDLLQLQEEVAGLSANLDKAGAGLREAGDAMEDELSKVKRYAGLVPLSGPGIELSVYNKTEQAGKDATYNLRTITDAHLLKIVNELYSAGAEAIAVSGQRLTAVSEIRLAGNHINVNDVPLSPPYQIAAIGNTSTMKGRIEIKGGFVDLLSEYGISVDFKIKENITVPAFKSTLNFEHASPVKI